MFATKSGEVATDVVDVPGGSAIVAVEEMLPAAADDQVLAATGTAVLSSIQSELLGAYEAALRQTYDGLGEPGGARPAHGAEGAMTHGRAA